MASIEQEDLYQILGVASTASHADIQAAYKKKARQLHPDVNRATDAEEQFKRLGAAYEILKDEGRRARYDAFGLRGGAAGAGNGRSRKKPRSQRPRQSPFGGVRFEDINVETDDLKNPFDFFLRREQQRRRRDATREVQLDIPIEHAFTGTTLNISVELPTLKGVETRKLRIKIPKGAKAGDRLKLTDPDIVVILEFEHDPRWEVSGRDVTMTLRIAPWEAALGGTVSFNAPSGTLKLRIPEGTSTGKRLRLRGQGLPVKTGKSGDAGDLYVNVEVVIPEQLTPKERSAWEALAETSSFKPKR